MERIEKNNGKNLLKGSLLAGALFSLSALSAAPSTNLFSYNVLGTGAEVRSEILRSGAASPVNNFEMKCGGKETSTEKNAPETKKADGKKASKTNVKESKTKEATCGDKKAEATKTSESKTKEAKCGEGKCGK